mgnify:CR=1 FL=1
MRGISKKGQEMSISTLVLIVLAIIVLVIVVIGFTGGWSNLWDRITNLGGGKANVGLVVQACQIACDTSSKYDYCSQSRKVTFDDKTSVMVSCQTLTNTITLKEDTCYDSLGKEVTVAGATSETIEELCKKTSGNIWNKVAISKPAAVASCDKFTC